MPSGEIYEFGEFTLEASERRLSKNGRPISLAPKAHDVLVTLVRNANRLVTKADLLESVWHDSFVEEGILSVHISALRKALGGVRYIETISRAGYRFNANVTARTGPLSIAVLPARPFTTEILSGRDRTLGLALSDALIDRLGRVKRLILRPVRAVQALKNLAEDPAASGRALRVDSVVDLQFLRTADGMRLSVRLVRSGDGEFLWSKEFSDAARDIAGLADVVANAVVQHLGFETPGSCSISTPVAPEVYEFFGRGRSHLLSASMFEVPKAIEAFQAAVDRAPTYARAHAGLALAHCAQAEYRVAPHAEAYAQARAAALRALALDAFCADAQVALGAVLFLSDWSWTAAEKSLERALELNPNHTEAYLLYGRLIEVLGQLERALEMKLRALERDPFSPLVHLQISMTYWNQRRYDDAIEWANKTLALDPKHPHAREHLAAAYLQKGDVDRYMQENIRHAEVHGAPPEALEPLKRAYASGGRSGVVKLVIEHALTQPSGVAPVILAIHYGEAGDLDAAFEHLDRAIENRDPALVYLAVGPQWDRLRGDPRFSDRLEQMGLR